MATPVPAVDRATAILRYLAERPAEPQTLSDTARATGIHKATCAAILGALGSHGLVSRTDDRRYAPGGALVGLAYAFAERFPGSQTARREMFLLATRLGLSSSLTVLDGDEMVVIDIVGNQHAEHILARVGSRFPMTPPMGTIFKVWESPEEIKQYMTQMEREFNIPIDQQLEVISTIRSQGYSLSGEEGFSVELSAALRRIEREHADVNGITVTMMVADRIRQKRSLARDQNEESESVNYIVAPIFSRDHHVIMCMNLFGEPGQLLRRNVPEIATQLLEVTGSVSASIGGSPPSTQLG